MTPPHWLLQFARDVTSQCGEDGIIEKILEVIGQLNGWCVEFGAWDGKYLSNTYNLIVNKDYSAVLFEGDPLRHQELCHTYAGNPKVIAHNTLVGFDADKCLDVLLEKTPIPPDFDLLSIDIDGNDYHVWKAVQVYRPKVVVIEFNPTIPNAVEFVQPPDMHITQGSSLSALDKLARQKGYALVCTTKWNAFFVDENYFPLFGIADNSIDRLRVDQSLVTYIFHGFDGQVFLSGSQRMAWHGMNYNVAKMQQLPRWLRKYPGNYSRLQRRLWKWYRALRQRKLV